MSENSIEFVEATAANMPEWSAWVENLMRVSFPEDERRPFASVVANLRAGNLRIRLARLRPMGEWAGIATCWPMSQCCYLEYTAVSPDMRGRGLFRSIMEDVASLTPLPILFEVEWPTTPEAVRRIAVYEKLGMVALSYRDYVQPAYTKHTQPVPMMLMSNVDDCSWNANYLNAAISEILENLYNDS